MNGLLKYSFHFALSLINISLLLNILSGCKPPLEQQRSETDSTTIGLLRQYERTFDPTEYDVGKDLVINEVIKPKVKSDIIKLPTTAVPETIAGFRVQVLMTNNIDHALSLKDTLLNLIPDQWVYVVYDAPYYKVRVGNYINRPNANEMMRTLIEKGYTSAWIVPDQILKNPPLRPKETSPEEIEPKEEYNQRNSSVTPSSGQRARIFKVSL